MIKLPFFEGSPYESICKNLEENLNCLEKIKFYSLEKD